MFYFFPEKATYYFLPLQRQSPEPALHIGNLGNLGNNPAQFLLPILSIDDQRDSENNVFVLLKMREQTHRETGFNLLQACISSQAKIFAWMYRVSQKK